MVIRRLVIKCQACGTQRVPVPSTTYNMPYWLCTTPGCTSGFTLSEASNAVYRRSGADTHCDYDTAVHNILKEETHTL